MVEGQVNSLKETTLIKAYFFIIAYNGRIASYRGVVLKSICTYRNECEHVPTNEAWNRLKKHMIPPGVNVK